jgi:hypothetical protein
MRPLQNAVNDARALDKALQGAGFKTILRENSTKVVMEQALADFLQGLGPDDTALFFYAGHAVQIENENVLIPVDFSASSTVIEAKFKSVSLAMVFDYLRRSRVKRSIIVIDACRSNPVAEGHSLQAGLAIPLNAGKETYIAFSTSPNHVATDNPEGKNSWFTEALADFVSQPALTIDEIFNRVRSRVEKATDGRQTPWSQTSLTGRFYFHPPLAQEADNDPTMVEKWVENAALEEQHGNWPEAIDLLGQVLKKQPGGALEQAAQRKLPYLLALNEAEARFDALDFAAAAGLYDKAFGLDAFSIEAAFRGIDSHLLNDRLPEAVGSLKAVRVRGPSAAVARADAMLKQLAPVSPEAAEALKSGVPQPPPAEELFGDTRFGVVDPEAGARYLRASPVELARLLKDIAMGPPPGQAPPPPVIAATPADTSAAPEGPVNLQAFHVEMISVTKSRDILIREVGEGKLNTSGVQRPAGVAVKVTTDPPGAELTVEGDPGQHCQAPCILSLAGPRPLVQARLEGFRTEVRAPNPSAPEAALDIALEREFGFVQLGSTQAETAVLLDGRVVSRQVPVKLQLPAGRYELRASREGKILNTQQVEVKPLTTVEISVEQ